MDSRAKEELVEEIGAAMLCAALGMEPTQREGHADYIAGWLTSLRNDKRTKADANAARS